MTQNVLFLRYHMNRDDILEKRITTWSTARTVGPAFSTLAQEAARGLRGACDRIVMDIMSLNSSVPTDKATWIVDDYV